MKKLSDKQKMLVVDAFGKFTIGGIELLPTLTNSFSLEIQEVSTCISGLFILWGVRDLIKLKDKEK